MKQRLYILICFCVFSVLAPESEAAKPFFGDQSSKYRNDAPYTPVQIEAKTLTRHKRPRNVVLFIGDGMGVAHVYAGMTANRGHLNLEYLKIIGFSKTQSANQYVTDSGAGATAIATGVKTYNGAIGLNADSVRVPTLLELAEHKGLSTGLISTSAVTHATPAAFIAHEKSREMVESIARDFLETDVDVVIGGGWNHFVDRADGESLLPLLEEKGYTLVTDQNLLSEASGDKLFALLALEHLPPAHERGDMLSRSVEAALKRLSRNDNGFFLMVEGSQIDWGSHHNDTQYITDEMLDLDRAIGVALLFAADKGETLIICMADHETGGMTLEKGSIEEGWIQADFTSGSHTGVMVPVFAGGPGAADFGGIYENTALFEKIRTLLKL